MQCPNCGTHNPPQNGFCLRCGTELAAPASPATGARAPGQVYAPQPQYHASPYSQPLQQYAPEPYPPQLYAPYGAPRLSLLHIWGPFAGYGTRRRHVGWLMNGEGHRAPELVTQVQAKFSEREIPGVTISQQTLVAKGIVVETRPYFLLRRGLASLALYISEFGHDLFVSQASYLKPPISNFRVLLLIAMLLFTVSMFLCGGLSSLSSASALGSATSGFNPYNPYGSPRSSSPDLSGLMCLGTLLICCLSPLSCTTSIALPVFFGFSAYKWLVEKDFWAALRVPPNEFNEDDLMAMEKAVEEVVRQSLTDLKLNPDNLKAMTVGQGGQLF